LLKKLKPDGPDLVFEIVFRLDNIGGPLLGAHL